MPNIVAAFDPETCSLGGAVQPKVLVLGAGVPWHAPVSVPRKATVAASTPWNAYQAPVPDLGSITFLRDSFQGGALFGLVGLGGLVFLDIASYLVSAALISLVSVRSVAPTDQPTGGAGETTQLTASAWVGALREWFEGLRLVGRDLRLAAVFAVVAVAMVGEGVITVLIIVFVKDVLGGGSPAFSWIITAYGAGGIAGYSLSDSFGDNNQEVHHPTSVEVECCEVRPRQPPIHRRFIAAC